MIHSYSALVFTVLSTQQIRTFSGNVGTGRPIRQILRDRQNQTSCDGHVVVGRSVDR